MTQYTVRYDRDWGVWLVHGPDGQKAPGTKFFEEKDKATDIASALTVAYRRGRDDTLAGITPD